MNEAISNPVQPARSGISPGSVWRRLAALFRPRSIALLWCAIVAFSALRVAGPHHNDELGQITSFYLYKLGLQPAEHLAWEFAAQMRSFFQPAMYATLLRPIVNAVGYHHWAMERLMLLVQLALTLVVFPFFLRTLLPTPWESLRKTPLFWGAIYLASLWFVPSMIVRHSSEALSAVALAASLSIWHRSEAEASQPALRLGFASGLLSGIAFISRFQVALFVAGFWFGRLVFNSHMHKPLHRRLAAFACGVCCALLVGFVVDWWGYGAPTFAAWNYFVENILHNRAASFGVKPFYFYLERITVYTINPLIVLWLFGSLRFSRKAPWISALSCGVVLFVVVHSLIGHKEDRFLFPVLAPACLLLMDLFRRVHENEGVRWGRWGRLGVNRAYMRAIIAANILVLVVFSAFGMVRDKTYAELALWQLSEPTTVLSSDAVFVKFGVQFGDSSASYLQAAERTVVLTTGELREAGFPIKYAFLFAKPAHVEMVYANHKRIAERCQDNSEPLVLLTNRELGGHARVTSLIDADLPTISQFPPRWLEVLDKGFARINRYKLVTCGTYLSHVSSSGA